jgi:hypothetical protein
LGGIMRCGSIGGAKTYPATISLPNDMGSFASACGNRGRVRRRCRRHRHSDIDPGVGEFLYGVLVISGLFGGLQRGMDGKDDRCARMAISRELDFILDRSGEQGLAER